MGWLRASVLAVTLAASLAWGGWSGAQQGGLPPCLPPGTGLPPGLPPGVSLPTCPPGSSSSSSSSSSSLANLASVLAAFSQKGTLPSHLTEAEIAALLAAPSGVLPPALAAAVQSLRSLGTSPIDLPVAAKIACYLQGSEASQSAFPPTGPMPQAIQQAFTALATSGALPNSLLSSRTHLPMFSSSLTEGDFAALLLPLTTLAPGSAHPSTVDAAFEAAIKAGLFSGATRAAGPRTRLDWKSMADLVAQAFRLIGGAQQAPLNTLHVLGVLPGVQTTPSSPISLGDGALVLSHVAALAAAVVLAQGGPTIVGVQPGTLLPGSAVTLQGRNFGSQAGTVTWSPTSGASMQWPVSDWSDSAVTLTVPSNTVLGPGKLILNTASGQQTTVSLTVGGPALRVGRSVPGGMVQLVTAAGTFFVPKDEVGKLLALPANEQENFAASLPIALPHGQGGGRVPTVLPNPPPLTVRVARSAPHGLPRRDANDSSCANGCSVFYGPETTPFSPSLSSVQVQEDVPCVTLLGYQVCSGWADGGADLGGEVNGVGYPNGYFTEVGAALSGASLISAASMDATLGFSYTAKANGDLLVVTVRVLTNQVDGGVGVAGAGTAPVYAYATSNVFAQERETLASRLSTISASVGSWPDLSAADLAEQSLSKLDALNDTAQTLWQLQGLPGELGTPHSATFTWSGIASAGESIQVQVDTQAIAAANGLSQTEVNAVSGVVLAEVQELPPQSVGAGGGSGCHGIPGPLTITSVTPKAAQAGDAVSVSGSGFGTSGLVELYDPRLGIVTTGQVGSWSPHHVTVVFPMAPPGADHLWVFPWPFSCGQEKPATFQLLPPTGQAGFQPDLPPWGPSLTVTGAGFGAIPSPSAQNQITVGPGPSYTPFLASFALTPSLTLVPVSSGASSSPAPQAPLSFSLSDIWRWENDGIILPLVKGPGYSEGIPLSAHAPPGRYEVVLRETYTRTAYGPLQEVFPKTGTSASLNFVGVGTWPRASVRISLDLGQITIPGARVSKLVLPAGQGVLPGSLVTAEGSGFSSSGTVVLVPSAGFGVPGAMPRGPNAPGSVFVPPADVTSWQNNAVTFRVPVDLAGGTYELWMIPEGLGDWATQPVPLRVAQTGCGCPGVGPSSCPLTP